MTATKLLSLLVAAALVTAGAGTVVAVDETATATATNTPTDALEEDLNETDVAVDASYDNGTVDLTVTTDDTGAENVSVTANGDAVGETDANGTLTFETNATDELELTLTGDQFTAEYVYAIENGSLVLEDSEVELDDEDGEKGPSENASETAHTVWDTIQQWMNGERTGNLGPMIQEALGHDNGSNGNADGNDADNPGKAGEQKPEHAKNAQDDDDAAKHGNGKQKAADKKGHGKDKQQSTDDADDTDEEETETDA